MGSDRNFETPYNMNNDGEVLLEKLLGRRMKEHINLPEVKDQDEQKISPEQSFHHPISTVNLHENEKRWSIDFSTWHSVSTVGIPTKMEEENEAVLQTHSQQNLCTEVELVYNLISFSTDKEEMAKTFLAMSSSPESCSAIRQSGCMPLLVQLIHNPEESKSVRYHAHQALRNIVRYHPDDKQGRREMRVLKLIEYLMEYCNTNEDDEVEDADNKSEDLLTDKKPRNNHPGAIIAALMKLSFDEEHRHAMCQLGALQIIAKLIEKDHEVHNGGGGDNTEDIKLDCVTLRRYAGMSLTNLTFGDGKNKSLLCSLKPFMSILISQLNSPNEELCQVTASVLRNLSWRADTVSKQTLRELGAVTTLMTTALRVKNESTLKAVLSALWNFSAHCNLNKIDICNVEGAVEYLVKMLTYQAPSKTLLIVENAGGILRNISSIIAVQDSYRCILRKNNCLQILVYQLKSPSLTVVSNACGTLWNLSARNVTDQRTLWQLGAVPMLRSLTHSKHKMISIGSSAALKNLLSSRPECELSDRNSKGLPMLLVRKRRALEQELDASLSETCDNIEQIETWDSFSLSFTSSSSNIVASNSDSNILSSSTFSPDSSDKSKEETANLPYPAKEIKQSDITACELDITRETNDTIIERRTDKYAANSGKPNSSNQIGNCFKLHAEQKENIENTSAKEVDKCANLMDNLNLDISDKNLLPCNSQIINGYTSDDQNNDYNDIMETSYNEAEPYGDYAETDLDQPTNYSLKYTEQDTIKTYYTEGTPYNFSSSNSMSDLHQVITESPKETHETTQLDEFVILPDPNLTINANKEEGIKEAKGVTFDTPMMFSRTSSLGSLSSCEQPDDRSSVVSDFSRMASGMISPSELPDSPSQTVPPSPHPLIKPSVSSSKTEKVIALKEEEEVEEGEEECGIFEDSMKVFKDENTPLHFSTATSLSSLTFDEDAQNPNVTILPVVDEHSLEEEIPNSLITNKVRRYSNNLSMQEPVNTRPIEGHFSEAVCKDYIKDDCTVDDLSLEEQQAMLDACIKNGISKRTKKVEGRKNNLSNYPCKTIPSLNSTTTATITYKSVRCKPPKSYSPTNSINEDSTVNFCTEDTPANISHAASNSDLSLLCPSEDSFLQDSILPLSSCNDDVELSLEDQKKLLHECIKAGLKTLNSTCITSESNDENIPKSSLVETVEDLPIHEQKFLLKKCILAGINNVTTTSSKLEKCENNSIVNVELPEEEQKSLLKQCIAMGMRNIKDISCDLENVGPPSFLAEANLENSLTNVDSIMSEIADSENISIIEDITLTEDTVMNTIVCTNVDNTIRERHTPKQKRRLVRDRYSTYTINTNQETQLMEIENDNNTGGINGNMKRIAEKPRKSFMIKERRSLNKDRFKTRTLSEGDFDDLATYEMDKINQKNTEHSRWRTTVLSSTTELSNGVVCNGNNIRSSGSSNGTNSDVESNEEQTTAVKAKVVKPLVIKSGPKVKSSIPIVNKPKSSQVKPSSAPVRSKIPTKLPATLQRQGTFTKDDQMATSPGSLTSPTTRMDTSSKYSNGNFTQSALPTTGLVKNSSKARNSNLYASNRTDVTNRWSVSDNSINRVTSFKSNSSSNLHLTTTFATKPAPCVSQTPNQPKKEVTSKIAGLWKKNKMSKTTNKP